MMAEGTRDKMPTPSTLIALVGLVATLVGGWTLVKSDLATVEARTLEHDRRLDRIEQAVDTTTSAISRMQVDLAGIAADIRNMRQAADQTAKR